MCYVNNTCTSNLSQWWQHEQTLRCRRQSKKDMVSMITSLIVVLNPMNWFIRWFINSLITWWVSCHMQGVHIIKAHYVLVPWWGSKQHYFWLVYQYIQFNSYSDYADTLIELLGHHNVKVLQLQAGRVTSSNSAAQNPAWVHKHSRKWNTTLRHLQ